MKADRALETRDFKLRGVQVSEEGTFTGYASTFGDVDAYGDTFARGAFRKTLADAPMRPLLWAHNPGEPIGTVELREDGRGLRARGRLILEVERAREAHALLRAGALKGLSIGFVPRKYTWRDDGEGRVFKEVELAEVSLTPLPANPKAVVSEVRSKRPADAEAETKEVAKMDLQEITQKVEEFNEKLVALGSKIDNLIAGQQEARALAPHLLGAAAEAGSFSRRFVETFTEKRSVFDSGGRLRFEIAHPLLETRAIFSPPGYPADAEDRIGQAAAAPAGSLLELIPRRPIDAPAVYVAREDSSSGWAAGIQAGEGAAKAEATANISGALLPVRTLAVWAAVSAQALDDVEGLRSFIDARLRWALLRLLETQILTGDGTGHNLTGLLPQAATFTPPSGVDLYGRLAHAVSVAELNGFRPTAAIVHPADFRAITLQRDVSGQYVQPPAGVPRLVQCAAMPEGQALVGDFSQCVLRVRQDVTIDISTEHADFFTKNLIAIRAEQRVALVTYSPAAFVKVSLA